MQKQDEHGVLNKPMTLHEWRTAAQPQCLPARAIRAASLHCSRALKQSHSPTQSGLHACVHDLGSSRIGGLLNGVNKLLDAELALAASVVHIADLAKDRTLTPALHMHSLEAGTDKEWCDPSLCLQIHEHAQDSPFPALGAEAPS